MNNRPLENELRTLERARKHIDSAIVELEREVDNRFGRFRPEALGHVEFARDQLDKAESQIRRAGQ